MLRAIAPLFAVGLCVTAIGCAHPEVDIAVTTAGPAPMVGDDGAWVLNSGSPDLSVQWQVKNLPKYFTFDPTASAPTIYGTPRPGQSRAGGVPITVQTQRRYGSAPLAVREGTALLPVNDFVYDHPGVAPRTAGNGRPTYDLSFKYPYPGQLKEDTARFATLELDLVGYDGAELDFITLAWNGGRSKKNFVPAGPTRNILDLSECPSIMRSLHDVTIMCPTLEFYGSAGLRRAVLRIE